MKGSTDGESTGEDRPPTISIVGLSVAGESAFGELIASIGDPRVEFIVVISAGSGTVSPWQAGRVTYIQNESTDPLDLISSGFQAVKGRYVYFAEQDSVFSPEVIEKVCNLLDLDRDIGVLYTDHAVHHPGQRGPWLVQKPAYSPERLRTQNYYGETVFYRTDLVRSLGWPEPQTRAALYYDLALRASLIAERVVHIPEVITVFTREVSRPGTIHSQSTVESTRKVLESYLALTGGGRVEKVNLSGIHDTRRLVEGSPLVSIVIPSRGGFGEVRGERTCLILEAVRSIVHRSTYEDYELVVVMDDVADKDVVAHLIEAGGDRLRLVWWHHPFSFSAKVNYGAYHAAGEYLLFLNDDTEVISPSWIEAMLALAQRPNAGMVGSMLYFEDDTIQHAGHIYEGGDAGHIGMFRPRGSEGPLGAFLVEREALGVTAACSLVSRAVFEEAGGFSLLLPGNFNDVDLCLKINELGYTSYWTPHAELYHYESKSRESRVARYEVETAWGRWEWKLDDRSYWPYGIWPDDAIG